MPRKNKYATIRDLVKQVKKNTGYDEKLIKEVIELYFEEIKRGILSEKQVRLSNFGVFMLKTWKNSAYYNPNDKTKVYKNIKTVSFKPSKALKRKVRDS